MDQRLSEVDSGCLLDHDSSIYGIIIFKFNPNLFKSVSKFKLLVIIRVFQHGKNIFDWIGWVLKGMGYLEYA